MTTQILHSRSTRRSRSFLHAATRASLSSFHSNPFPRVLDLASSRTLRHDTAIVRRERGTRSIELHSRVCGTWTASCICLEMGRDEVKVRGGEMTVRSGYVVLCCECCVGVMEGLEKEKLPTGIGTTLSDRTHLVDPSRMLKRLPFLGR